MYLLVVFLIMIHQCTVTNHLKMTLVIFDCSPPLCQDLLEGYEMLRIQLHSPHIQICGLNLNKDMACAGLLRCTH